MHIRMLGAHRPEEKLDAGGGAGQIWQDSSSGTWLVCCLPPGEKGETGAAPSLGKYILKSLFKFPALLPCSYE